MDDNVKHLKVVKSTPKEPAIKRVVVITPPQEKLFWFVLGAFCGCNYLAFMVAALYWIKMNMTGEP